MVMVDRSTNFSTSTNYDVEIATPDRDPSVLVHENHPEGPFWEGLSGKRGSSIRLLPPQFVLTKTHCGGRCINCPATDYYVPNATAFLQGCQKTSGYRALRDGEVAEKRGRSTNRFVDEIDAPTRVAKVVHLIRNPFDKIVARFHLERRHVVAKSSSAKKQ